MEVFFSLNSSDDGDDDMTGIGNTVARFGRGGR